MFDHFCGYLESPQRKSLKYINYNQLWMISMNYQMIPMKIIEPLGPLLLVVVQLKLLPQDHGVGPSVVGTGMLGLAWRSQTAIFFM
jgi:hypothetical protein